MSVEANTIYPYVAPETYLDELGKGNYVAWDYGQGLVTMLVSDIGPGGVRSIAPNELEPLGLSGDEAWGISFQNLNRTFNANELTLKFGALTSGVEAFIICDHWLASAFTLHPACFECAGEALKSEDLRLLVPSRDNAFVIRGADFNPTDGALKELYGELQGLSRKPFAFNVFRLTRGGPANG
jgi:hypothetical protein